MTNNYLKTKSGLFFCFDDRDLDARAAAWEHAVAAEPDPRRISIWRGSGQGRYFLENPTAAHHPVVDHHLQPISPEVQVVGYAFRRMDLR